MIGKELTKGLDTGTLCYHSVLNLLSFCLQFENTKIRIYMTLMFPVVLYGFETLSLTLREGHRWCLRMVLNQRGMK
jgi:hypothetical protein